MPAGRCRADAGGARDRRPSSARRSPPRLPAGAITETIGELTCAVIGPTRTVRGAERRSSARSPGRGARAGLGTTVDWAQAALSFARARAALELAGPPPALVVARDRAGELLLRSDRLLAGELAADQLAPLRRSPAGSRARLTETLRVWLAEQGRLGQVAERLGDPSADGALPARSAAGAVRRLRSMTPTRASGSSLRCGLRRWRTDPPAQAAGCGAGCCGSGSGSGSGSGVGTSGPSEPARDLVGPRVHDRYLVVPRCCARGTRRISGPVPVAVPVVLAGEPGHLRDLVAVVVVERGPGIRWRRSAARSRRLAATCAANVSLAEAGRVPLEDDQLGHRFRLPPPPGSRPGPSAVLPWPSAVAPTRIAILPRCLLSRSSWWASATPLEAHRLPQHRADLRLLDQLVGLVGLPGVGEVRADDLLLPHPQVADVEVELVARGGAADHDLAERLDAQGPRSGTSPCRRARRRCRAARRAAPRRALQNRRDSLKRAFSSLAVSPPRRIMPLEVRSD